MPTAVESIASELQGRIGELREEQDRLMAALGALKNGHAGPAKKPARAPKASARKAVRKPVAKPATPPASTNGLSEAQIVKAIHTNGEPASVGQIREALGRGKDTILPRTLKAMVQAGTLKTQGIRAGTRYSPA